jgi:hypothetical protein
LPGMRSDVLDAVTGPARIYAGNARELLAVKEVQLGKWLVVVYGEVERRFRHHGLRHPQGRLARKEEAALAVTEIENCLRLLPRVKKSPQGSVWISYDKDADTLYANYNKPSHPLSCRKQKQSDGEGRVMLMRDVAPSGMTYKVKPMPLSGHVTLPDPE